MVVRMSANLGKVEEGSEGEGDSAQVGIHQKALAINLDRSRYGSFAEIGAGQEVARWFFRVGGASGAVAKTISAYDMKVSDEIYGKTGRYVSCPRLDAMLDHEYSLMIERLDNLRGSETCFFAFADTVSTRNFAGTNESHGWMGVRFQVEPRDPPCDVILHVNMNDRHARQQQEALGILGVNLLFSAFFKLTSLDTFFSELFSGLNLGRLEVDYIEFRGERVAHLDAERANLMLVRRGLARAIVFDVDGTARPPSEVFHHKAAWIERGAFRALHQLSESDVALLLDDFKKSVSSLVKETIPVVELSINNLLLSEQLSDEALFERVRALRGFNHRVLVSMFSEYYHLTGFLRRYTHAPIGFVLSMTLMMMVFDEKRYSAFDGGILGASAQLLRDDVRLYVYPVDAQVLRGHLAELEYDLSGVQLPERGLVGPHEVKFGKPKAHLYQFLMESGIILST